MRVTGFLKRQGKNPEYRTKTVLRSRNSTSIVIENARGKQGQLQGYIEFIGLTARNGGSSHLMDLFFREV